MASIAAFSYFRQRGMSTNDHDRIIEIAREAGLQSKKGDTLRIYRKKRNKEKGYVDYVYKMPLGLSLKQFRDKKHLFVDGLNNKSKTELKLPGWCDIKESGIRSALKTRDPKQITKSIKQLFQEKTQLDKQIEITYDGMLRFRVYERGLEKFYPYDDALLEKLKGWEIPIGYSRDGLVKHDFEKMQMLVVAGRTRYGKTVALKNIITTLIAKHPDDVKFTLIDLKGGLAFGRFARCRQVLCVAKNASETLQALEAIHEEMLKMQAEFLEKGYEDIGEAGLSARHFVIVDEGAEIASFVDDDERKRCLHLIGEIARLGAGLSYRLVFATQYPTADVFPRAVKANTSAALCFKLTTGTQSMVVLDRTGAEELPVGLRGRAIYQSDQDVLVQTPFIENTFIDHKIRVHIRDKKETGIDFKEKGEHLRAGTLRASRTSTFEIEEV